MHDETIVPEHAAPGPMQRVIDTFVAPTKAFAAVCSKPMWWVPFLLMCLVSLVFAYVVLHKVGVETLVDGMIHQSSMLEDRIANATPAQAAQMRAAMAIPIKLMYAAPFGLMITGVIGSGILLLTANFGFGGKASFEQMLGVWFYGMLPQMLIAILTIVTLYAGANSDSFNLKDPVGTNIGYYLMGGSSPHWLIVLLSSVDVLAIWSAVLMTLGVSMVAGIKRGSAAIMVFGWWALYVLLQVAVVTITG
jgi:hypothetical protein